MCVSGEKKCHFYFGFVEADEVFSSFLSGRSFQIFKEMFFLVFIHEAVVVSLVSAVG